MSARLGVLFIPFYTEKISDSYASTSCRNDFMNADAGFQLKGGWGVIKDADRGIERGPQKVLNGFRIECFR